MIYYLINAAAFLLFVLIAVIGYVESRRRNWNPWVGLLAVLLIQTGIVFFVYFRAIYFLSEFPEYQARIGLDQTSAAVSSIVITGYALIFTVLVWVSFIIFRKPKL